MCRPWHFTASVACQIWHLWNSAWLDCIILVCSVTAGTVQGTSVIRVEAAVWSPAWVSSRSYFVPAVYGWTVWCNCRMRFHMPHVCWQHTDLPQHTSLWPHQRDGTPGNLHRADSRLNVRQSLKAKRRGNSDHLAGYSSATEQAKHSSFDLSKRHDPVFNCSQRPWCCTGQQAYSSQSCCCTQPFLFCLHPTAEVN